MGAHVITHLCTGSAAHNKRGYLRENVTRTQCRTRYAHATTDQL